MTKITPEEMRLHEDRWRDMGVTIRGCEIRWCTNHEPHFAHTYVLHQNEKKLYCPGHFPEKENQDDGEA